MFARRCSFGIIRTVYFMYVHYIVIVTPVWPACTEIGRRSLLSCSYLYCKRNIHLVLYIYHRLFLLMTFKRYFILKRLQAIMFPFNIAENYTYLNRGRKIIRNSGNCVRVDLVCWGVPERAPLLCG